MSKKNGDSGQRGVGNDQGSRDDKLEFEGVIDECMPGTLFKVKCPHGTVLCTLAGKLRQNRIRLLAGDRVRVEVSPYDVSKGRVSWRY